MPPVPSIPISPQPSSLNDRFRKLRSVKWRINLGILPSSAESSIEDLRRVTADSRRRYACLRKRLLVDLHFPKEVERAPDLAVDNPLSQNPESTWGRFFRNAELEKMVDQDLSRLYPGQESYFQTNACQAMLRRILLLWCLQNPAYGYRQGMHELLAPLLYVLHVDVQHLFEVRELYEDVFNDRFDSMTCSEANINFQMKSSPMYSNLTIMNDCENKCLEYGQKVYHNLDELEPDTKTIVLLSDAYGAEGELGILLSARFIEHDAYCMFDALMNGANGLVALAEFFSPSPAVGSSTGLPPIIEASLSLYHLLSIVDLSLHSHLVELGVEPQYFSLRWLRVLFGREFSLEDLLIIWDKIFASSNNEVLNSKNDSVSHYVILTSPGGAFIIGIAVAMLLHRRSSLLATENATSCLQRLLSFPENINLEKLLEKAKSLQVLALDPSISTSPTGSFGRSNPTHVRGYSLSSGSASPRTPLHLLPESYWEEKWRVLHKADEFHQNDLYENTSSGRGILSRERVNLSRAESAPSSTSSLSRKRNFKSSARRRLLEDLSPASESEEVSDKLNGGDVLNCESALRIDVGKVVINEPNGRNSNREDTCLGGNIASEEESSIFSASASPCSGAEDHDDDSEKSSVASNACAFCSDDGVSNTDDIPCSTLSDKPPLVGANPVEEALKEDRYIQNGNLKQMPALKERKPLSGKFQWFWRLGRGNAEGAQGKEGNTETHRTHSSMSDSGNADGSNETYGISGILKTSDPNMLDTLRNLGQSMLEHIQVMESVFQQELGQVGSPLDNLSRNVLSGKRQATALAALKELRKISNVLSDV